MQHFLNATLTFEERITIKHLGRPTPGREVEQQNVTHNAGTYK